MQTWFWVEELARFSNWCFGRIDSSYSSILFSLVMFSISFSPVIYFLQLRNQNRQRLPSRFRRSLLWSFARLAMSARGSPETWPGKRKSKIGKRNSSVLPSLFRLFCQDVSGQSALHLQHHLVMPGGAIGLLLDGKFRRSFFKCGPCVGATGPQSAPYGHFRAKSSDL